MPLPLPAARIVSPLAARSMAAWSVRQGASGDLQPAVSAAAVAVYIPVCRRGGRRLDSRSGLILGLLLGLLNGQICCSVDGRARARILPSNDASGDVPVDPSCAIAAAGAKNCTATNPRARPVPSQFLRIRGVVRRFPTRTAMIEYFSFINRYGSDSWRTPCHFIDQCSIRRHSPHQTNVLRLLCLTRTLTLRTCPPHA